MKSVNELVIRSKMRKITLILMGNVLSWNSKIFNLVLLFQKQILSHCWSNYFIKSKGRNAVFQNKSRLRSVMAPGSVLLPNEFIFQHFLPVDVCLTGVFLYAFIL